MRTDGRTHEQSGHPLYAQTHTHTLTIRGSTLLIIDNVKNIYIYILLGLYQTHAQNANYTK